MSTQPPTPPPPPGPPPPTGPPSGPPPPPPNTPLPSGAGMPPPEETDPEVKSAETKALIALIFGIANIVLGTFCCGLLWIPALILGNQALAVLDMKAKDSGSRGIAVAARVLAFVGIGFMVLYVLVALAYGLMIAGVIAAEAA